MSKKTEEAANRAADKAGRCQESTTYENMRTGETEIYRCMFQNGHVGTCVGSIVTGNGKRKRKAWFPN